MRKAVHHEVYEDNAGQLFLAVLDESENCIDIFQGFECDEPGTLSDAIRELCLDPMAYEWFDGSLKYEDTFDIDINEQYTCFNRDANNGQIALVVRDCEFFQEKMGYAAKIALNLTI